MTPFAAAATGNRGSGGHGCESDAGEEAAVAVSLAHASAVDKALVTLSAAAVGPKSAAPALEPPPASKEAAEAVASVVASATSKPPPAGSTMGVRQLSLRHQLSAWYPGLITPSEHVEALRGPIPGLVTGDTLPLSSSCNGLASCLCGMGTGMGRYVGGADTIPGSRAWCSRGVGAHRRRPA